MPCYDPRSEAPSDEDRRHNSEMAQLLCEAMSFLMSLPNVDEMDLDLWMSRGLHEWWAEHQERDRLKASSNKN